METGKGVYVKRVFDNNDEDLDDVLDFANMVFSMSSTSIDFAALYPKAYSEKRCALVTHHIIKEKDKIRALADSYPLTMRMTAKRGAYIEEIELKAVYIGAVSVHPKTRGKGYMTELMKYAEDDARRNGCSIMIVDGNRHRYRNYGFERAGIRYSFDIELNDIMHCCDELYDDKYMESPVYAFDEICADDEFLDYIYGLYVRRYVTARTRSDFFLSLQSENSVTYVVYQSDMPVGYINMSEDEKCILEFEVEDMGQFPRIIYDLMVGIDCARLGISVGMDETCKIVYLEKMCNYCNAAMSHQIKILDYIAALEFMFLWKRKFAELTTNEYVIGVQCGSGIENYQINVMEDDVRVKMTDVEADTVLEELEFVRLLTTNLCFAEQIKGKNSKIKNAPAGWFPLPFYLPDADAF